MKPTVAALLTTILMTGCVSISGTQPQPTATGPLPYVEQARCGEFSLVFRDAFNGEEEGGTAQAGSEEEHQAVTALLNGLVAETGLVGYVGQEGLEGTRLTVQLRRNVKASVLHGVASALTLLLVPYWVEVSYDLRAEMHDAERLVASSRARASWFVVVHPFLLVAYPFDEPTDLVDLVRRMARFVLTELVEGEAE